MFLTWETQPPLAWSPPSFTSSSLKAMDAADFDLNLLLFGPDCPSSCIEEIGLGKSPLPKPTIGKHRHPVSDPNESLRNELTQCQNCWVSKGPGVTFSRCGACKIEIYCVRPFFCKHPLEWLVLTGFSSQSKACQKKVWPSHKEKCEFNRITPISDNRSLRCLQKFTSKHRPVLADAAIRALELSLDIERSLHFVLAVFLRRRPDSQRPETSYFATGAGVIPFELIPAGRCEELKEQVRKLDEEHKKTGMDGGLFVVLMCWEERTMNIAPVGFSRDCFHPPGTPWKELLFAFLNEGVVK
ncbi:hypothetical protein NLI96_g5173 [Meripilus lineatus]|uniref:MYND-type domain-containing protein n=1 Tax=Meripilus lineatus TaxID=2056292 RepID=A0AAD5YJ80_9APHY|nr:hypothetical protein NLI96_g5173 [Physisporinus lineatus]